MKRLIINADDLGLTRAVNEGIVLSHRDGILTSASIMPTGQAFEHALKALEDVPELGVGVHICLTGGRGEFLSPGMRAHPRSFRGFRRFLHEIRGGGVPLDQVEEEIDRQIHRCFEGGLSPTHIDSHHHIHLYPPVMERVLRTAKRYGLSRIRMVRECYPIGISLRYFPRCLGWLLSWSTPEILSTTGLGKISQKKITAFSFRGPDRFFGTHLNRFPSLQTLEWILDCVPEGISELMVHPGFSDHELASLSKLGRERAMMVDLLTSKEARNAVERRNLQPSTFADV